MNPARNLVANVFLQIRRDPPEDPIEFAIEAARTDEPPIQKLATAAASLLFALNREVLDAIEAQGFEYDPEADLFARGDDTVRVADLHTDPVGVLRALEIL